ncbi:HGGxSTG domain-containing protein [Pseudoroseomonas vastitatis]|nr:HGGxSTG domain-containing protein [Pseudoroseomonas vastitatis]
MSWDLTAARLAPRCGAKTRAGTPCAAAGMANGRCKMHGGKSTGPRTAEGIERIRAARMKHGMFSGEMRELRALIRELKAEQKVLREKA